MSFYTSIAPWYDTIFPLRPAQLRFLRERIRPGDRLLDIGCATGELACALASEGHEILGVEPDEAMLRLAQVRAPEGVRFIAGDMRNLNELLTPACFDVVLCLGNTLVHLDGPASIALALKSMARALSPKGALILQIINYDRILTQRLDGLPTIKRGGLRFERRYHPAVESPHLNFETRLITGAEIIENSIPLYPLRRAELDHALRTAGLRRLTWLGGFDGSAARPEAQPLIAVARPPL